MLKTINITLPAYPEGLIIATTFWLMISATLFFYYLFIFYSFFYSNTPWVYPQPTQTLSSLLSDSEGSFSNIYCLYPTKQAKIAPVEDSIILKKVAVLDDCQGWLGIASIKENWWNSEFDKYTWGP